MRWLGATPNRPATLVERVLQIRLQRRVVSEEKRAMKRGGDVDGG